jgi:hypothetical protein
MPPYAAHGSKAVAQLAIWLPNRPHCYSHRLAICGLLRREATYWVMTLRDSWALA